MQFLCKKNQIKYLQDKQHLWDKQEATDKGGYKAERKGMYGTTVLQESDSSSSEPMNSLLFRAAGERVLVMPWAVFAALLALDFWQC